MMVFLLAVAHAQPMLPQEAERPTAVYVSVGVDDAVLSPTLGAAHTLPGGLTLGAELGTPLSGPDFHDRQAAAWAGARFVLAEGLQFPVRGGLTARSTENDAYTASALGTEVAMTPGWYGRRFGIGASLAWRQSWLTWIDSSDFYRTWIMDTPTGWYTTTGMTVRAGVKTGLSLGKVELGLDLGWQSNGKYAVLLPPVYATVEGALSF